MVPHPRSLGSESLARVDTQWVGWCALIAVLPLACSGGVGSSDETSAMAIQPGSEMAMGVNPATSNQPPADATGLGMPASLPVSPGEDDVDSQQMTDANAEAPPTADEPAVEAEPALDEEVVMEEQEEEAPTEPNPVEEPVLEMDEESEDEGVEEDGELMSTPGEGEVVSELDACAAVQDWDPEWTQFEDEVLLLVNEERALGADCGSQGSFDPAEPLGTDPLLRCAARLHSMDMFERAFFDHTNPDGDGPGERLDALVYEGRTWGENIAYGQSSPEQVVSGWMNSDGHCSNIMSANFELIGVGYHPGSQEDRRSRHYWTQVFGAGPFDFGGGGRGGGFGQ